MQLTDNMKTLVAIAMYIIDLKMEITIALYNT